MEIYVADRLISPIGCLCVFLSVWLSLKLICKCRAAVELNDRKYCYFLKASITYKMCLIGVSDVFSRKHDWLIAVMRLQSANNVL